MQSQDFENDCDLLGPLIAIPENECLVLRTTSRSVGNVRSAVSNDLAELLVQDEYIKKLLVRYFRLWRNASLLVRLLALRRAAVKKVFFEVWHDAVAVKHTTWDKIRKLSIRVHRQRREDLRRSGYFVPLVFQWWSFLRRLRRQLGFALSPDFAWGEGLASAWTPLQIKEEWWLWLRDNVMFEKKMVKLWLKLVLLRENRIRKNIRTRQRKKRKKKSQSESKKKSESETKKKSESESEDEDEAKKEDEKHG